MRRLHRQLPFLRSVLKEADQHQRGERLQLANADQINALSELVMNMLRGNVPLSPANYKILLPHRNALRDMARKKNSIKRRREIMQPQTGGSLWHGLNCACERALKLRCPISRTL